MHQGTVFYHNFKNLQLPYQGATRKQKNYYLISLIIVTTLLKNISKSGITFN